MSVVHTDPPEAMSRQICLLGSMATRGLLAELAASWDGQVAVEAAGGIEVARRLREGEIVDVLVLAGDAMRKLEAEGFVVPGSLAGVAVSSIAVAVREGDTLPDLDSVEGVKRMISSARRIGYSTGPSGDHVLALVESWGMRDELRERLVQAPPGVPVGRLLVEGTVDLAVQQRSELLGIPGVTVAGVLPPPIANDTVFTAGIARTAPNPESARQFIAFLTSAATTDAKRRNGLQPT